MRKEKEKSGCLLVEIIIFSCSLSFWIANCIGLVYMCGSISRKSYGVMAQLSSFDLIICIGEEEEEYEENWRSGGRGEKR